MVSQSTLARRCCCVLTGSSHCGGCRTPDSFGSRFVGGWSCLAWEGEGAPSRVIVGVLFALVAGSTGYVFHCLGIAMCIMLAGGGFEPVGVYILLSGCALVFLWQVNACTGGFGVSRTPNHQGHGMPGCCSHVDTCTSCRHTDTVCCCARSENVAAALRPCCAGTTTDCRNGCRPPPPTCWLAVLLDVDA